MGELLGALGLAWPRLLLYPGGLFALLAARLLAAWLGPRTAIQVESAPPSLAAVLIAAPPLLMLSLLPLAPARGFPFGLDLVIALALLEWPRLLALRELDREELTRDYLPLLVAATGMAEAVGGLELTRLLRAPEQPLLALQLAAATALWLVALPRLIATGPAGRAGELRALGLLAVGTLPLLGGLAALLADTIGAELAGWLLPPVALLAAGAALGAPAHGPGRLRARATVGLGAVVVGLLALGALVGPA